MESNTPKCDFSWGGRFYPPPWQPGNERPVGNRVKVDKKDGFGLFVMDTKDVCAKWAHPLSKINEMILKKAGSGIIIMCQFENYAGR